MEFLLWLEGLRSDALNSVLMNVTDFIASPVVYVGIALLYWCFSKRSACFIAMNISFGSLINQGLKNTFCIMRPWLRFPELTPVPDAIESATGYSFPSGHTQLAAAEFLSIARLQKKRTWVVVMCVILTMLVMFTRNYLGVHTFEDVFVSMAVSVAVIFANERLLEWVDSGKNRDWIVFGAGMAVCSAFLAYTTLKQYPDYSYLSVKAPSVDEMITDCYSAAGCVYGFLIGWVCERHFLNFSTDVSRTARVARGTVGSVLLLLLVLLVMKPVTALSPHWGELGFFAFAFVFILFIYPSMFVLWEKAKGRAYHE